jgi:DNA-binding MarR family transcriptional regulator
MSEEIQKLIRILRELQKINPEFPIQYALCFSEIYQNPGLSVTELATKVQIPISTVSRIISALSGAAPHRSVYNLVNVTISSKERRKKVLNLSDEGLELIDNLKKVIKK